MSPKMLLSGGLFRGGDMTIPPPQKFLDTAFPELKKREKGKKREVIKKDENYQKYDKKIHTTTSRASRVDTIFYCSKEME